jgi:hypothetical protein
MENAVSILRDLWRHRLAVVALALVALVTGGLVAYQPSLPPKRRQYSVGTSSVRILVDTTDSRVVAIAPPDQPVAGEDLGGHASLLAQLLSQGVAKAAIAKHAGVAPDKLIMIAPTERNQKAQPPRHHSRTADVLAIHALSNDSGEPLPIIGVDAEAANGERAAKLAKAAVAGLEDYLKSKAVADGVPPDRQLLVRALSVAQGRDVTRGPTTMIAIGVVILVFGLLCALLLVGLAIARQWRVVSAAEGLGSGGAARTWPEPDVAVESVAAGVWEPQTAGVRAAPQEPAPEPAAYPKNGRAPKAAAPRPNPVGHWNDPPA